MSILSVNSHNFHSRFISIWRAVFQRYRYVKLLRDDLLIKLHDKLPGRSDFSLGKGEYLQERAVYHVSVIQPLNYQLRNI